MKKTISFIIAATIILLSLTACSSGEKGSLGSSAYTEFIPFVEPSEINITDLREGKLTQEKADKYSERLFGDKTGLETRDIFFGITNIKLDVPILKDEFDDHDFVSEDGILYKLPNCMINISVIDTIQNLTPFSDRFDKYIKDTFVNYDVYENDVETIENEEEGWKEVKISGINDGSSITNIIKVYDLNNFTFVVRIITEKNKELDSETVDKICNLYKIDSSLF